MPREVLSLPDGSLDDVVVQAEDEGEGSIGLELVGILLQHRLEEVDISRPDGCQGRNQLRARNLELLR